MEVAVIDRISALAMVANGREVGTHVPAILLPKAHGEFFVQSLEDLQLNRSRFRGGFNTNLISAFDKYVSARKGGSLFVDAADISRLSCKAVFNLGDVSTPGHGDDTAVLALKATAAFDALRGLDGKKLNQRQMAELIEDWHQVMTAKDSNGEQMSAAKAAAGIRNMKIVSRGETSSKVGDLNRARSAMEEIEAKSAEAMPVALFIETPPFNGFKSRSFGLRISVIGGGEAGEIGLSLRWQSKEQQCEEIAEEFSDIMSSRLGGIVDAVHIGTFSLGK